MMANTLPIETRRHIESLQFHGAMVGEEDPQPLTVGMVEEIIQRCKENGWTAVAYDLKLDGIDDPMAIAIWANGHVDSGSLENIMSIMFS